MALVKLSDGRGEAFAGEPHELGILLLAHGFVGGHGGKSRYAPCVLAMGLRQRGNFRTQGGQQREEFRFALGPDRFGLANARFEFGDGIADHKAGS